MNEQESFSQKCDKDNVRKESNVTGDAQPCLSEKNTLERSPESLTGARNVRICENLYTRAKS